MTGEKHDRTAASAAGPCARRVPDRFPRVAPVRFAQALLLLGVLALLLATGLPSAQGATSAASAQRSGAVSAAKVMPGKGLVTRTPSSPSPSPSAARLVLSAPRLLAPTDGWLVFQGDPERDGYSPDAVPSTTQTAWNATLPAPGGGSTPVTAGVVTSGNLVYVASGNDYLYALDVLNGTLAWRFLTAGPLESTPALHQGLVLVASQDGNLYELNATNGGEVTSFALGAAPGEASPVAIGDNVLVPCSSTKLCAFNLTTRAKLWSDPLGAFTATPSYDPESGLVFLGNSSGWVTALYPSNGTVAWTYEFEPTGGSVIASPIIGNVAGVSSRLTFALVSYPSGAAGELAAFNDTRLSPGTHPFYVQDFAVTPSGSAALVQGNVVVPTQVGQVLAFSADSGNPVPDWSTTPWSTNSNPILGGLIGAQHTVLVPFQGKQSGGSGGSELAEINATTGAVVTTVTILDPIVGTPAIDSAAIFVADREGIVYAIGPSQPGPVEDLLATSGNSSLAVSWAPPYSFGGVTALSEYQVSWGPNGRPLGNQTEVSPSTTSLTLPGLSNGVEFNVSVAAVITLGTTNVLGPSTVRQGTPGVVPYPPQNVTARVAQHLFEVTWQAPLASDDGGFPLTGYLVRTWNASSGPAHTENISVISGTSWKDSGVPDNLTIYAEVAAVNSRGMSSFTSVVSGTPYLAKGLVRFAVEPSSVWGAISVHLSWNGTSMSVPIVSGNGTARLLLLPGVWWVNASASGYQGWADQVVVASGSAQTLNISMSMTPSPFLGLTTTEFAILVIAIGALLLLAIIVIGTRYRRLQEVAESREAPPPEEPEPGEGISVDRAREFLEPQAPLPPLVATEPAEAGGAEEGVPEEEEEGTAEEEPAPEEPEEEQGSDEPEGAGGRLGEYWARRKAAKETLKSPDADTPEPSDNSTE